MTDGELEQKLNEQLERVGKSTSYLITSSEQLLELGPKIEDSYKLVKGVYRIRKTIEVSEKGKLEIEPGTKLLFDEDTGIDLVGPLKAIGNEEERIIFTAHGDKWRNIRIRKSFPSSMNPIDESILEYCEITKGTGYGHSKFHTMTYSGGAIMISGCSPRIKYCIIKNNNSENGAGIYADDSFALIEYNTIENNNAKERGGGMTLRSGKIKVKNNKIRENTAKWEGGGAYLCGSSAVLDSNSITHNSSNNGGGISMFHSGAKLKENEITHNTAQYTGGGIYSRGSAPRMKNNTIKNNKPDDIRK